MAKIIQFSGRVKRQGKSCELTELLKEALSKIDELPFLQDCSVVDGAKFKRLMEARIMRGIIQKKEISASSFLCGLYSAEILTKFLRTAEGDLGRISQLEKFAETRNPYFYQTAGDHLFYICAVFPENADRLRRQLKLQDYHDMGSRCYYTFYDLTGIIIGYHMSQQFSPMANIIRQHVICPKK